MLSLCEVVRTLRARGSFSAQGSGQVTQLRRNRDAQNQNAARASHPLRCRFTPGVSRVASLDMGMDAASMLLRLANFN